MSLLGVLFSEMKVVAIKRAAESTSQSAPAEDDGGEIRCVCKNSQSCLVNVEKNEILNYVFAFRRRCDTSGNRPTEAVKASTFILYYKNSFTIQVFTDNKKVEIRQNNCKLSNKGKRVRGADI